MLRSLDMGTVLFSRLYNVCGTLVCRVRLQLEVHHHRFLRVKLSVSYLIAPSWVVVKYALRTVFKLNFGVRSPRHHGQKVSYMNERLTAHPSLNMGTSRSHSSVRTSSRGLCVNVT
jgi:hypothetical protein